MTTNVVRYWYIRERSRIADEGKLRNMPGVDTKFDEPTKPELVLSPEKDEKLEKVINYLESKKIFPIE